MPNTLAHFAVNGLITRGLIARAELPWVYAGCVIPDVPWIFQRATKILFPGIDAYDLRLFAVNQASLFVSLVLCAALSSVSVSWRRTFGILGLGVLLHLLLDACQVKWANGVSLFVPFDWSLVRFDLFWPENPLSYILTLGGILYFVAMLGPASSQAVSLTGKPIRWCLASVFGVLYFVLPFLWIPQALSADNHFVATLCLGENRTGRTIEFDRVPYSGDIDAPNLVSFAGESLLVTGLEIPEKMRVSIRGKFVTPDTVAIRGYHIHHAALRDFASYVGLSLAGGLWLWCLLWPIAPR